MLFEQLKADLKTSTTPTLPDFNIELIEDSTSLEDPLMEEKIIKLREKVANGEIKTPIPCNAPLTTTLADYQDLGVDVAVASISSPDIKVNIEQKELNLDEFDFSGSFLEGWETKLPTIPANMQCVTNDVLADTCITNGLPVIHHRYFSIKEQVKYIKNLQKKHDKPKILGSCGTRDLDKEFRKVAKLFNAGFEGVCIDITHGSSYPVMWLCKKIKECCPDKKVVIGNICNYEDVIKAARAGADGVKVGMGPGSPCTTRDVTGVGEPQLSAVMMCALAAKELGLKVIADGGILDAGLTLALGADSLMYGQLFCKTYESLAGRKIEDFRYNKELEQWEVLYFGEASAKAQSLRKDSITKGTVPEGDSKWVKAEYSLDELITQIKKEIARLLDKLNLKSISELKKHVALHGFSQIINFTDSGTQKLLKKISCKREKLTTKNLIELDNIKVIPDEFKYIGKNKLKPKHKKKVLALMERIALSGPQVGIPISDIKSSAQKWMESEKNHPKIADFDMKNVCLSPSYADKDRDSRRKANVKTKLTPNISLKKPYIPANKDWVLNDELIEEYSKTLGPPILPPFEDYVKTITTIEKLNGNCIPTIFSKKHKDVAKRYIKAGVKAINIELTNGNIKDSIILCEKLKKINPDIEIIISGIESFDDALQAITAGASSLKVNIENKGASKIASVYAATKEFNVKIIAEADWIGTKDANTAIALGADVIMESERAFSLNTNPLKEYKGNPPLGTKEFPKKGKKAKRKKDNKNKLFKTYKTAAASLLSSQTLQGSKSISELHKNVSANKTAREVADGYSGEKNTRKLSGINKSS